MSNHSRIDTSSAPLQDGAWPLVNRGPHPLPWLCHEPFSEVRRLLAAAAAQGEDAHGEVLHDALSQAYAYRYGYADSPIANRVTAAEARLAVMTYALEDELLDTWLGPEVVGAVPSTQAELAAALRELITDNTALDHVLFDYIANEIGERALREFLYMEVVRNEVVDDEVALLTVGLQGPMKAAAALNHADEAGIVGGQAHLERAHTYWLRELLTGLGDEQDFLAFRERRPWFVGITSNTFNMLLLRPPLKMAAYGHFLMTESWVAAHFEHVLEAMARHGLGEHDVYFAAHARIDPFHTDELVEAVERQMPVLYERALGLVLMGARVAITAATKSYDLILAHLRELDQAR